LLGLARVVEDGVLYFYISDEVLLPELRGSGHGASFMKSVIRYLAKAAKPGATIFPSASLTKVLTFQLLRATNAISIRFF
jgi:hypothetical protein